MNATLRQTKESEPELRQPDSSLQPLHQYFNLLQTSLDRYEYLKKSGAPDIILYMEKGLISRQLLFLSKVCVKLAK